MLFSYLCYLRTLVFDQSSQVHPVSESSGCGLSVTKENGGQMEILVSNIGLIRRVSHAVSTVWAFLWIYNLYCWALTRHSWKYINRALHFYLYCNTTGSKKCITLFKERNFFHLKSLHSGFPIYAEHIWTCILKIFAMSLFLLTWPLGRVGLVVVISICLLTDPV